MSNQTKHTPGPWRYVPSEDSRCALVEIPAHPMIPDEPRTIAMNHSPSAHGEGDANARLIAAAPELLEALRTLTEAVREDHPEGRFPECQLCKLCADAELAIAKAEGRTL